jgi:hypothetical protein
MPTPEEELLGPGFERRLKAALDSAVPPSPLLSSARFRTGDAKRPSRAWRFAPALVVAAAAAMAVTATAATGSPNPATWRDRAGTIIQTVGHFPGTSPKAAQSPKPPRTSPASQGTGPEQETPSSGHQPEPSTEPADSQEQSPRPAATPGEHPAPSPTSDSSGGTEHVPSPTPSDQSGD